MCPGVCTAVMPENGRTSPSSTSCSTAIGSPVRPADARPIVRTIIERSRPGPGSSARPCTPSRTAAASSACIHTSAPVCSLTAASPPMWSPCRCVTTMPRSSCGARPSARIPPPIRSAPGSIPASISQSPPPSSSTKKTFTPLQPELVHAARDLLRHRRSHRHPPRPDPRSGPSMPVGPVDLTVPPHPGEAGGTPEPGGFQAQGTAARQSPGRYTAQAGGARPARNTHTRRPRRRRHRGGGPWTTTTATT